MTKDRRLGRGLAALLGSPLEEEHSIDGGSSTATITAVPKSVANSAVNQANQPVSVANLKPASNASGIVEPSRTTVTGSVPLREFSGSSVTQTLELSVYEIDNNPFQPRRKFNPEEIASLAASIRDHEQLQPILVRRVGDRYQLISGERRLRATIHAGLKTIRAEVREADDRLVAELAIIENLQRKDLDAIEKALSFRRYIDQHKCTQEDLAKRLKIDRSTIANLMRLLELPQEIQLCVQNDTVTAGHARALLPLGNDHQQLEFARLIQAENWNVRETERRVAEVLASEDKGSIGSTGFTRPGRKKSSPQVASLEQQMRSALGTKTEIRQNVTGRGKITIHFSNAEEFERLCALICPQMDLNRAA